MPSRRIYTHMETPAVSRPLTPEQLYRARAMIPPKSVRPKGRGRWREQEQMPLRFSLTPPRGTLIPPPMPSLAPAAEAASWGRMMASVGKPAKTPSPGRQAPPRKASSAPKGRGPRLLAIPGKRGICCRGDIVQCTVRNGYGRASGLEGFEAILSSSVSQRGGRTSVNVVSTPDTNMFEILRVAAKPVGGSMSAVRERARSTYYVKRNGREFWDFNY